MPRRVRAFYNNYCSGEAISHIALSLCRHMSDEHLDVRLLFTASDRATRHAFTHDALPAWLQRPAYRFCPESCIRRFAQWRYVNWLAQGDIAYIWPGCDLKVYEALRSRGHTIVMERINTHRATSKSILDVEYQRLGLPPDHGITEAEIDLERRKTALADHLFCPSPLVLESFASERVPRHKLLLTSYGWDPTRIRPTPQAAPRDSGFTVLFVGRVCIRKGAHLLLQAWAKARIPGRLVLVGSLEPAVAKLCSALLSRSDVLYLGHTRDVAAVYRGADVFAFPTLEEGSPLVSYEALASGLPMLTSPMGAGEIVRDGVEGLIRDPHDEDAWSDALNIMARDSQLISRLARNARERSQAFTWHDVGQRRSYASGRPGLSRFNQHSSDSARCSAGAGISFWPGDPQMAILLMIIGRFLPATAARMIGPG